LQIAPIKAGMSIRSFHPLLIIHLAIIWIIIIIYAY